jgi:ectoine hydroxylase-related dioxygenase (phytanoyl-CoA dioxygenase family)
MELTPQQRAAFVDTGYLLLHDVFTLDEVDVLSREIPAVFGVDSPARIMEKDGVHVRTVFGAQAHNAVFDALSRHPRLVEPARDLIGEDVYIHQFKINAKIALVGDLWQWHQDYIYWLHEDGMVRPAAITAALFLDDVTEFNGPLLIVPRSHRLGVIETRARQTADSWKSTVIADLKYALGPEELTAAIESEGIVAPKGKRGAVLWFHCNSVHGSVANMSAIDRKVVFVSYNAVSNALEPRVEPRPWFMANRDFTPIEPVPDDVLNAVPVAAAEIVGNCEPV